MVLLLLVVLAWVRLFGPTPFNKRIFGNFPILGHTGRDGFTIAQ
jgi:hypothetical protein